MEKDKRQDVLGKGLNVNTNELLTTSELSSNASHYVREVWETGNRRVLTKNGKPVAGLVPIWFLTCVDMNWFPDMDICSTCPGRVQKQTDLENDEDLDLL